MTKKQIQKEYGQISFVSDLAKILHKEFDIPKSTILSRASSESLPGFPHVEILRIGEGKYRRKYRVLHTDDFIIYVENIRQGREGTHPFFSPYPYGNAPCYLFSHRNSFTEYVQNLQTYLDYATE